MWADNETKLDLLDFRHLVSAITGTVRNQRLLPVTIGVFGDWGSGKSSLIAMVREELELDDDILCVSFNGWLFEGYEDAKAALMGTILDEIRTKRTLTNKAKELVGTLLRRVRWFRLMGMLGKSALAFSVGLPPGGIEAVLGAAGASIQNLDPQNVDLQKAQELIEQTPPEEADGMRRDVREFRRDFGELLKETRVKTLVVFIDDLDRCLPDTVIATLEAIKLFLFVDDTAFIIGADENLVQHAVKLRFPEVEGSKLDVGRNYLEKLVQIPIRIPPLGRVETETYMNLLFTQLHTDETRFEELCTQMLAQSSGLIEDVRFGREDVRDALGSVPPELEEALTLSEQISDVLTAGLDGNPRQTKRFLNTLVLRVEMAEARQVELRRRVLAKLMLLEYFRTETSFRTLAGWQAEQSGIPNELRALEAAVREEIRLSTASRDGGTSEGNFSDRAEHTSASRAPSVTTIVSDQAKQWLDDEWLRNWLLLDPPLEDVDLRPYFYFARDRIGALPGPSQRLSSTARDVLGQLIGKSEPERIAGASRAAELSSADIGAVFQALADRVRRAEDLGADDSPLDSLYRLVGNRKELIVQLIELLTLVPESRLTARDPVRVRRLVGGTSAMASGNKLIEKWSHSSDNPQLATAAENILKRNGPDGPQSGGQ